jgi:hypothetical protein
MEPGIEMADWAMKIFRCGLAKDAWDHPEVNIKCFQEIEAKLDELRSYLYANSKAVSGYACAFRQGERVGTARVESTANEIDQLALLQKTADELDQGGSARPTPR